MDQKKKPSRGKRIAAVIGIVLLVALYVTALVSALIDHPLAHSILMAALFCTFLIPVMIYLFELAVRLFRPDNKEENDDSNLPPSGQ